MKLNNILIKQLSLASTLLIFSGCFNNNDAIQESEVASSEQTQVSVTHDTTPSDLAALSTTAVKLESKVANDFNNDALIDSVVSNTYDPFGNLLTKNEDIRTSAGSLEVVTTYINSYNDSKQLISQRIIHDTTQESITYTYANNCETLTRTDAMNQKQLSTQYCYNNKRELLSVTEFFNADEVSRIENRYSDNSLLLSTKKYHKAQLTDTINYETIKNVQEEGKLVIYSSEKHLTQTGEYTTLIKTIIHSPTSEDIYRDIDADGIYNEHTSKEYVVIQRSISNGLSK